MAIQKVRDLEVYNLTYQLAMEVFAISKAYPMEEKYSLIDQIRRSSRSVAVNISEGYGKRHYPDNFKRHLIDAMGSTEETKSWLEFSKDCDYINRTLFKTLYDRYEEAAAKIYRLHESWK